MRLVWSIAATNNHSAEAEHKEILEQAPRRTRRVPLSEALMKIPPGNKDGDYRDLERQDDHGSADVFN